MNEQLDNIKESVERLLSYGGLAIVPVGIAFSDDVFAVKSLSGDTLAEFGRYGNAVSYALDVIQRDLALAILPGWRSYQEWVENNRPVGIGKVIDGQ